VGGAALWNQVTSASWSFAEAIGAARFSSLAAVTSSIDPNSNSASVVARIHITNKAIAMANAGAVARCRWCHHIAIDAATNAPAPYPAIKSGPMSRVISIVPISTSTTNKSGET
jgi:hypothetical protein